MYYIHPRLASHPPQYQRRTQNTGGSQSPAPEDSTSKPIPKGGPHAAPRLKRKPPSPLLKVPAHTSPTQAMEDALVRQVPCQAPLRGAGSLSVQIQRSDIPDSEALSATVRLNTSGAGGPKLQVAPANLDIYACRGPTLDAGPPRPRGRNVRLRRAIQPTLGAGLGPAGPKGPCPCPAQPGPEAAAAACGLAHPCPGTPEHPQDMNRGNVRQPSSIATPLPTTDKTETQKPN